MKQNNNEKEWYNFLKTAVTMAEAEKNKEYDALEKDESLYKSFDHQKLNQNIQKLIKKEKRINRMKKLQKYSGRAAIILLSLCLVSGISIFSVDAWRIKFINFIFETRDTNTKINFVEDEKSIIVEGIQFNYLPEGFKLEFSSSSRKSVSIKFLDDNERHIFFQRHPIETGFIMDTEDTTIKNITIKDHKGFINSKNNITVIVWNDDEYSYTLDFFGFAENFPEEEMVKIAENIIF